MFRNSAGSKEININEEEYFQSNLLRVTEPDAEDVFPLQRRVFPTVQMLVSFKNILLHGDYNTSVIPAVSLMGCYLYELGTIMIQIFTLGTEETKVQFLPKNNFYAQFLRSKQWLDFCSDFKIIWGNQWQNFDQTYDR